YLLPHDVRLQTPDRPDEDYRRGGLSIDDLGEALSAVLALKRVLIFDTCDSGSAAELAGRGPTAVPLPRPGRRFTRAQGVHSLAATKAGEQAVEHPELGHGVLTYALLAACGRVEKGPLAGRPLPAPAGGRDVDVLEWFAYARRHVPDLYRKYAR